MQKLTYYSLFALSSFLYVSISLTALHHILIIVPAAYYTYTYLKNKDPFISCSHTILFFIITWSIIATLLNLKIPGDHLKNLLKLKYLIIPVLGVYASIELFKNINEKDKNRLIRIFLLTTTLATIAGLIAHFTGIHLLKFKIGEFKRASGAYGMVMSYAYSISIFSSGLLAYIFNLKYFKEKLFNNSFLICILALNLLGLYFSYTRGGFLAFIISFPFIFIKTHKKIFWAGISIGSTLAIAVCYISVFNKNINFYRLNEKDSNSQRITIYKTALYTAKDNLWTGVGYRNFEYNCPRLRTQYGVAKDFVPSNIPGDLTEPFCGHSHSNYLSFLTNIGIPGLALFLIFLGCWFKELWISPLPISLICIPMLVNFSFSGLFQNTFTDGEITFFIMGLYMTWSSIRHISKTFSS